MPVVGKDEKPLLVEMKIIIPLEGNMAVTSKVRNEHQSIIRYSPYKWHVFPPHMCSGRHA